MSEPEQVTPPPHPGRRVSWGRVGEAVFLVLVAAGTFADIWFFPWPIAAKKAPATTLPIKEHIEGLKKAAEREAAEKRAERERRSEGRP